MLVGDTCKGNASPFVARPGPKCAMVSACSAVGASLLCRVCSCGLKTSRRCWSIMRFAAPNDEQLGCLLGESGLSGLGGSFGERCLAGLVTGKDASRLLVKTDLLF
jgi:hypothetical protein